MKGLAYIMFLGLLGLFVAGLFYTITYHIYDTGIYTWGESHITGQDSIDVLTWTKMVMDNWPLVLVLGGFVLYIVVQSQKEKPYI